MKYSEREPAKRSKKRQPRRRSLNELRKYPSERLSLIAGRMRKEAKKRQREDGKINLFWRMNKTFPKQF